MNLFIPSLVSGLRLVKNISLHHPFLCPLIANIAATLSDLLFFCPWSLLRPFISKDKESRPLIRAPGREMESISFHRRMSWSRGSGRDTANRQELTAVSAPHSFLILAVRCSRSSKHMQLSFKVMTLILNFYLKMLQICHEWFTHRAEESSCSQLPECGEPGEPWKQQDSYLPDTATENNPSRNIIIEWNRELLLWSNVC